MGTTPASVREALDMVHAGLSYLAAADAAQLSAATQAECLHELEQADAVATAARAVFLAGFTAGQGYADDAEYSAVSWLMHRTGITKAAAVGHAAWANRVGAHPRVLAALAARQVSESAGRLICLWTNRLPEKFRDESDELLIAAAAAGLGLAELAGLAAEMYERSRSELPDEDPDRDFADRGLKLATTFGGAGVLHGDLTPECAAVVQAVLDALSAPAGAEDDRTRDQRYHDALQEAMRRLAASNLLPERAGQPVKAWAHISLADMLRLDGSSALQEQWTAQVRARWAAHRAAASETGSDSGAWLDGDAAEAIACDAAMAPIVTGEVDIDALDDLVRLCVELDGLRRANDRDRPDPSAPDTTRAWAALEQAVIGKAVDLLSGPGGLASFLRRRQLGARLGGPSLPLDIGYAETVPAGIRNAVILRDQRCRWAGGCDQPAAACEVHHTRHKANGGPTSITDCVLLCTFHHQVIIHRQGWTLVLNPDGTTTAWNKDKTKILHSHGPPGPGKEPATHIALPGDHRARSQDHGVVRGCVRDGWQYALGSRSRSACRWRSQGGSPRRRRPAGRPSVWRPQPVAPHRRPPALLAGSPVLAITRDFQGLPGSRWRLAAGGPGSLDRLGIDDRGGGIGIAARGSRRIR